VEGAKSGNKSPLGAAGCRFQPQRLATPELHLPAARQRRFFVIARVLDYIHELRINVAQKRCVRCPTPEHFKQFKTLLLARSPRQVAKMERDMGIS